MDAFVATCTSPVGILTLSSDGESLTGLKFDRRRPSEGESIEHIEIGGDSASLPIFVDTISWLKRYFKGENPCINDLKLSLHGTDFQIRVWNLLRMIPYGTTTSYGALAKQLHSSARAVGTAVGRNPIGIITPCHRVIGANGQLTGFAGGLEKKIILLEHENHQYNMPKTHNGMRL